MKCEIIIDNNCEEKIIVYARDESPLVKEIKRLADESEAIIGYKDKQIINLNPYEIICVTVIGNKVYAVCENEKFLLKERLYTLEEKLPDTFIKINQSCIANTTKIERFDTSKKRKKKFAVSCQHYSFCVKAFIDMVKKIEKSDGNSDEYDFAINETRTLTVIEDVTNLRSEIGILHLSDFNRSALEKVFKANDLIFEKLVSCNAYVYLWKKHPLAKQNVLTFEDLKNYPCLMFDQNASSSFYYAEEILAEKEYSKIIRTTDRATNLNLMKE